MSEHLSEVIRKHMNQKTFKMAHRNIEKLEGLAGGNFTACLHEKLSEVQMKIAYFTDKMRIADQL